jgi:oxygen-independent coproporphyrinogen-3 oxidase
MSDPRPFGLYLHWPFCRSKCPYCDFNSHVRAGIDERAWHDGLLAALDAQAAPLAGRRLDSIFFGGGTPSLMPSETVAALIARARHWFEAAPDLEVTLEANPTSAEAARFRAYRAGGVTRLSLGIQALDQEALRFLGREHDAEEATAAITLAHASVPRVSFDLIYARPNQSVEAWLGELDRALALVAGHVSLYQLTIEAGTRFETLAQRGDLIVPDDVQAAQLWEATQAHLAAAGLPAYEISNHARPGEASRHNLVYWRYGDYLGVGPGAHGRITTDGEKRATRQHKAPETWLATIQAGGDGMAEVEPIDHAARRVELTMMGLRLTEGIPAGRFERELGQSIAQSFDQRALSDLIEGGFIEASADRLTATPAGRQRLNAVLEWLL